MSDGLITKSAKLTFPIFMGYIPLGMAFGVMLVKAGYPWQMAPLMSVLMFAGSGQFLAVSFFAAGAGMTEIVIATLLVQLRHSFYGLSLLKKFENFSAKKYYMIFALTDETYAVMTSADEPDAKKREKLFFLIALFNHLYWILGGLLGAIAGRLIPYDMKGIDFTLTALFTVLALEKFRQKNGKIPVLIGAASAAAALLVFGRDRMLLASLCAALAALIIMGEYLNDVSKRSDSGDSSDVADNIRD